jgi:hypothetical protein
MRHCQERKSKRFKGRVWGFSDKSERQPKRGMMRTRRVTMLLFAIAMALSGCGVNYHVNPGPRSWPAAPSAPNK